MFIIRNKEINEDLLFNFVCLFLERQSHSGPGPPHSRGF